MSLDENRKNKILRNLNTLDYLRGTGVIKDHLRFLTDEAFLFISMGGNGHKALTELRNQMRWKVDSEEIAAKVRFLAIDCAHNEIDQLMNEQGYRSDEVLKLPNEGAHDMIAPAVISPYMKEWVDPNLYKETGGDAIAAAACAGFDSKGAGAWRQPGRVRLCLPAAIGELRNRIHQAVFNLLANKGTRKVKIVFLAGLAGGTGSGTVIDLPFIVRQIIKDNFPDVYIRTTVSAYLLLPSACGIETNPDRRIKGNRNAYTALKEIDYLMELQSRDEKFVQEYTIDFKTNIAENIFDVCTLVEGVGDGGTVFGNPADTARAVTANAILNMITTTECKGPNTFLVDSFLSNRLAEANSVVSHQPAVTFPRDMGYHFSVIGYSSCVIPIDLMTVYVYKKVFDRVYDKFQKCKEADQQAAIDFLRGAHLTAREIHKLPYADIVKRFTTAADDAFRNKGPFFMINLMRQCLKVIPAGDGEFQGHAQKKKDAFFGGDEWARTVTKYSDLMRNKIAPMNHNWYEVYTCILEEMKALLDHNAGLLTDSKEHSNMFERTFCWSPVDLTTGDHATKVVGEYLDSILNEAETKKMAGKFVDLLCDPQNRDRWTQVDRPEHQTSAKFDAAQEIRDFISTNFKELVNNTMESFLVKLYSGDSKATVPTLSPEQSPESHKPLVQAAQTLVKGLQDKASPLCATATGFNLQSCKSFNYITVPDGCKWMDQHIANQATAAGIISNPAEVYKSSAQDQIVMYRLYIGVPAFALQWTNMAESTAYDGSEASVGLHMEHGSNGRDWSRFPNLLKKKTALDQTYYSNAAACLDRAEKYGLLIESSAATVSAPSQYAVSLLKRNQLELGELDPNAKYTIQDIVEQHTAEFKQTSLVLNQSIVNDPNLDPAAEDALEQHKAFGRQLAADSLRHKMGSWEQLVKTLDILDELEPKLAEHNQAVELAAKSKDRRSYFLDALFIDDMITYNRAKKFWTLNVGNQSQLGDRLNDKIQVENKEYYAAQAFFDLEDTRYQQVQAAVDHWFDTCTDESADAKEKKQAEAKARIQKLRTLIFKDSELGVNYPMASLDFEEAVGKETATKIRDFYEWMENQF